MKRSIDPKTGQDEIKERIPVWMYPSTLRQRWCRLCGGRFKLAVEVSIMMNVLASELEINESDLDKLRNRCVREVKRTNGNISLRDAVRYQNGID